MDQPYVQPGVSIAPNPVRYVGYVLLALAALERGQGLCGQCGYDLRGNAAGTCPACGAESPWAQAAAAGQANPYVAERLLQGKESRASQANQ